MSGVQPIFEPYDHSRSLYDQLGGETGVRRIVDRFYDLMELEPRFLELRQAHGLSLDSARDKLFWFLSGYFGGPDLYISQFGHPRLRARHLPFAIGIAERDQWVACMGCALQDEGVPEPLVERLVQTFFGVADWMRNREG